MFDARLSDRNRLGGGLGAVMAANGLGDSLGEDSDRAAVVAVLGSGADQGRAESG